MGCRFLLQEIFLTQGLSPRLLSLLVVSWILTTGPPGKLPIKVNKKKKKTTHNPWVGNLGQAVFGDYSIPLALTGI